VVNNYSLSFHICYWKKDRVSNQNVDSEKNSVISNKKVVEPQLMDPSLTYVVYGDEEKCMCEMLRYPLDEMMTNTLDFESY